MLILEGRQPGDVFWSDIYAFGAQVFQGRLCIDGVPEHDSIGSV